MGSEIEEILDLEELVEWYKVQFEILFGDKSRLEKEEAHIHEVARTLMEELDNLINSDREFDDHIDIMRKMQHDTRLLELQDYLDAKYKLRYPKSHDIFRNRP